MIKFKNLGKLVLDNDKTFGELSFQGFIGEREPAPNPETGVIEGSSYRLYQVASEMQADTIDVRIHVSVCDDMFDFDFLTPVVLVNPRLRFRNMGGTLMSYVLADGIKAQAAGGKQAPTPTIAEKENGKPGGKQAEK